MRTSSSPTWLSSPAWSRRWRSAARDGLGRLRRRSARPGSRSASSSPGSARRRLPAARLRPVPLARARGHGRQVRRVRAARAGGGRCSCGGSTTCCCSCSSLVASSVVASSASRSSSSSAWRIAGGWPAGYRQPSFLGHHDFASLSGLGARDRAGRDRAAGVARSTGDRGGGRRQRGRRPARIRLARGRDRAARRGHRRRRSSPARRARRAAAILVHLGRRARRSRAVPRRRRQVVPPLRRDRQAGGAARRRELRPADDARLLRLAGLPRPSARRGGLAGVQRRVRVRAACCRRCTESSRTRRRRRSRRRSTRTASRTPTSRRCPTSAWSDSCSSSARCVTPLVLGARSAAARPARRVGARSGLVAARDHGRPDRDRPRRRHPARRHALDRRRPLRRPAAARRAGGRRRGAPRPSTSPRPGWGAVLPPPSTGNGTVDLRHVGRTSFRADSAPASARWTDVARAATVAIRCRPTGRHSRQA